MHGHSYAVEVHVAEALGEAGWVVDFSTVEQAFRPVVEALDHRVSNEVDGLENPTAECAAVWRWRRSAVKNKNGVAEPPSM